jgi:hypothetical protein
MANSAAQARCMLSLLRTPLKRSLPLYNTATAGNLKQSASIVLLQSQ